MAGVGGVACTFVRAVDVRRPAARLELWHVPGVSGVGSRNLGTDGGPFLFEVVYYGSGAAEVQAWHAYLAALTGTVVSIVDDWGTIHLAGLVQTIGPLVETPRVQDGAGTCRGATVVAGVFLP